jgi:hypothetical protein
MSGYVDEKTCPVRSTSGFVFRAAFLPTSAISKEVTDLISVEFVGQNIQDYAVRNTAWRTTSLPGAGG